MFLGSRPASGNRIGTATWPYNAQPVLLKNSTGSRPQGRNADYTTEWIPGPMGVYKEQSGVITSGLPVSRPRSYSSGLLSAGGERVAVTQPLRRAGGQRFSYSKSFHSGIKQFCFRGLCGRWRYSRGTSLRKLARAARLRSGVQAREHPLDSARAEDRDRWMEMHRVPPVHAWPHTARSIVQCPGFRIAG
jgi:hypothetical protein